MAEVDRRPGVLSKMVHNKLWGNFAATLNVCWKEIAHFRVVQFSEKMFERVCLKEIVNFRVVQFSENMFERV